MCYMLYLGSDVTLAIKEFDSKNPAFYITDADDKIKHVKKFFTKEHIYYVGAHTHCGCGFFYNSYDAPKEYEANKNSAMSLVATIKEALNHSETVELLVTWADKEDTKPKITHRMTPDQLIVDEFPLDEFHFVIFSSNSD